MPRVSIEGTAKSFEVKTEDIIYNALSDQGEELPHGCLAGSCGACRVEIMKGKENLLPPSLIEQNTIDAVKLELKIDSTREMRLSCRAKVLGDVTLRPLK
jgi:ferredoxin